MRSDMELVVQKRNTRAFIEVDPVDVVLTRFSRVPNGAGGYRLSGPVERASQRFRLVLQANRGDTGERLLLDGTANQVTHDLIGMPDADIAPGDKFVYDSRSYEVVEVFRVGGYEVKARVTTRA